MNRGLLRCVSDLEIAIFYSSNLISFYAIAHTLLGYGQMIDSVYDMSESLFLSIMVKGKVGLI